LRFGNASLPFGRQRDFASMLSIALDAQKNRRAINVAAG